ncbi:hypothetical protein BN873_210124 [Candidatus Competibacter denitrificans Run_A_D11]|uniref:PAS domain-containing protein n=1 Tax=Candidatus Competibacter denitrificans Run_A_D11 TaxID=1400863 RepID=W6MCD2_9GAMM|nr:hypothetical protein [Candidatus Competibacter denitrificans]CDI01903.1 hypothetical protein BN873_210124 [Candidatus Competibacter denitrificans Run_A_D11]
MRHDLKSLSLPFSALDWAMFESHRAIKLLIDPESGCIVQANPAACEFYQLGVTQLKF